MPSVKEKGSSGGSDQLSKVYRDMDTDHLGGPSGDENLDRASANLYWRWVPTISLSLRSLRCIFWTNSLNSVVPRVQRMRPFNSVKKQIPYRLRIAQYYRPLGGLDQRKQGSASRTFEP